MDIGRALQLAGRYATVGQREEFSVQGRRSSPPPDDPGNPTVNFHGEERTNQTHESTTDPDAFLARKNKARRPSFELSGNLLVENRNGLIGTIDEFELCVFMVFPFTAAAARQAATAVLPDCSPIRLAPYSRTDTSTRTESRAGTLTWSRYSRTWTSRHPTVAGLLNCGWLNALKNSARNTSVASSRRPPTLVS